MSIGTALNRKTELISSNADPSHTDRFRPLILVTYFGRSCSPNSNPSAIFTCINNDDDGCNYHAISFYSLDVWAKLYNENEAICFV